MEKNFYDIIFKKHFGDSECRTKWESWSQNVRANIGTSIVTMEQTGPIPPEVIAELRQAILENDLRALYEIPSRYSASVTPRRHGSSFGCTIKNTWPVADTFQFSVDIDGENYMVIYGTDLNGGFCCIPDRGIGCVMSDADDVFYNAMKLFEKLDLRTSYAIAETVKKVHDASGDVSSDNDLLSLPWITTLHLSTRAQNCLIYHGRRTGKDIRTIGDIVSMTKQEIYYMRNVGVITRKEIANELKQLGVDHCCWYDL